MNSKQTNKQTKKGGEKKEAYMKATFERRTCQSSPRNRWKYVRKDANQMLSIINWILRAKRRKDWRKQLEEGMSRFGL